MSQRPDCFEINQNHPLAQGLVFAGLGAHAGSSRFHDSASGRTGTCIGGPVWSSELGRNVLDFEQSSDHRVSFSKSPPLIGAEPFTIAFWVKMESFTEVYPYVAVIPHRLSSKGFVVFASSNAGYYPMTFGGLTDYASFRSQLGTHPLGVWTHWTVTFNGGTSTLYTNYTLYYQGQPADKWTAGTLLTQDNMWIGSRNSDLVNTMDGKIADLCIWDGVAKSASEIQQLADPYNFMLSGLIREVGDKQNVYNLEGVR